MIEAFLPAPGSRYSELVDIHQVSNEPIYVGADLVYAIALSSREVLAGCGVDSFRGDAKSALKSPRLSANPQFGLELAKLVDERHLVDYFVLRSAERLHLVYSAKNRRRAIRAAFEDPINRRMAQRRSDEILRDRAHSLVSFHLHADSDVAVESARELIYDLAYSNSVSAHVFDSISGIPRPQRHIPFLTLLFSSGFSGVRISDLRDSFLILEVGPHDLRVRRAFRTPSGDRLGSALMAKGSAGAYFAGSFGSDLSVSLLHGMSDVRSVNELTKAELRRADIKFSNLHAAGAAARWDSDATRLRGLDLEASNFVSIENGILLRDQLDSVFRYVRDATA